MQLWLILIVQIAKTYHLEGKFEPSEFANSTLAEIIDNITTYLEESSIQNSKIESETTHLSSYVSSFLWKYQSRINN
ncbi:MAG: hypothetical protein HEQ09_22045 [Dolichospermum sp. UKL202]